MIQFPAKEYRKEMIRSHLSEFLPVFQKGDMLERAADLVDGFSGSDIRALCKEAAMRPLRRILQHAEVMDGCDDNLSMLMKRNPITANDFHEAIATVNRSTSAEFCERHRRWTDAHGSAY